MKKWIIITSAVVAIISFGAYRHVSNSDPCSIVASSSSKVYHHPGCPVAKEIPGEMAVCFDATREAQEQGYAPCPEEAWNSMGKK